MVDSIDVEGLKTQRLPRKSMLDANVYKPDDSRVVKKTSIICEKLEQAAFSRTLQGIKDAEPYLAKKRIRTPKKSVGNTS